MNDPKRFDPASVGIFRVTDRSFDRATGTVTLGYDLGEIHHFVETITFETPATGPARSVPMCRASTGPYCICTSPPEPATTRRPHHRRSPSNTRTSTPPSSSSTGISTTGSPRIRRDQRAPRAPAGGHRQRAVRRSAPAALTSRSVPATRRGPRAHRRRKGLDGAHRGAQTPAAPAAGRQPASPGHRTGGPDRPRALGGTTSAVTATGRTQPVRGVERTCADHRHHLPDRRGRKFPVRLRHHRHGGGTIGQRGDGDGRGVPVNHQYSKSLEFELLLRDLVHRAVDPGLEYGSALRPYSELAIARAFASMPAYHATFCSCNTVFRQNAGARDGWCGHCPKCRFVGLMLAPFLEPDALAAIIGRDMFADPEQITGFAALMSPDGKPFECVGERRESAAASGCCRNDRSGRRSRW